MKVCPVALAIGCAKCPVFKVCPAKGVIGDFKQAVSDGTKEVAKETAPGK